jgi:hypothetical protein
VLRALENHPAMLEKVRLAIFELHPWLCDTERCKALLRDAGFRHEAKFRGGDRAYLHMVWR